MISGDMISQHAWSFTETHPGLRFQRKATVCLTTEVIRIGAISNMNGKTIEKLCSTILKAAILWWSGGVTNH